MRSPGMPWQKQLLPSHTDALPQKSIQQRQKTCGRERIGRLQRVCGKLSHTKDKHNKTIMSYFFWTFLLPAALVYLIIQQRSSSKKNHQQLSELQEQLKQLQQLLEQNNRHAAHSHPADNRDAPAAASTAVTEKPEQPSQPEPLAQQGQEQQGQQITVSDSTVAPTVFTAQATSGEYATEHTDVQADTAATASTTIGIGIDTDNADNSDADTGDADTILASVPLTDGAAAPAAAAADRSETLLPLTDGTDDSATTTWSLPDTSLTATEDGLYITGTDDTASTDRAETDSTDTAKAKAAEATEATAGSDLAAPSDSPETAETDTTETDTTETDTAETDTADAATTATAAASADAGLNMGETEAEAETDTAPAASGAVASVTAAGTPETDEHSLPVVTSVTRSIVQWFTGGNLIVRVGVLFLLLGVVFLLRLANEYFAIPLTAKLLLVAAAGCVTTFIGLKISRHRPGYGLTLQGAGFATVYFTLFSAYRLYSLLPASLTFALLALFAAANAFSAVRQNALSLALLAFGGAFFAPVLTSTGAGNVVHLFTYYLVLNIAVAWMAHHRTWKILNLLSAFVTLGLGFLWGMQNASGDTLASMRWQLVTLVALHMLLYLFISLRYSQQLARHHLSASATSDSSDSSDSSARIPAVDMGLLFGVAIMGFGLLAGLLHDVPYALAAASGILAAVYGGMWWYIRRHRLKLSALQNGLLALSTGFATLTIPLALNAQWTSVGWGIQAAALIWTAKQQRKSLSMLVGLVLLTVSSAMAIQVQAESSDSLALISTSLAAMFSAFTLRYLHIQRTASPDQSLDFWENTGFSWTLLLAATGLWLLTTLLVTSDIVENRLYAGSAVMCCLAVSSILLHALWYVLDRKYCWVEAHNFSRLSMPLLYLVSIIGWHTSLQYQSDILSEQESYTWLWILCLLAGTAVLGILWLRHRTSTIQHTRIDQLLWFSAIIWLLAETAGQIAADGHGIAAVFTATALCLLPLYRHRHAASGARSSGSTISTDTGDSSPNTGRRWLNAISLPQVVLDAGCIVALIAATWFAWANAVHSGTFSTLGLPYIPLLNPLDIALLAVLALWFMLYRFETADRARTVARYGLFYSSKAFVPVFLTGLFWMANSILIRLLHATADTPLWTGSPWHSSTVQTGFTIFWSALALVLTISGNRLGSRRWWWLGKALLIAVVLKLLLVDLSSSTTILRVVSFMGAGILMMVIGYFAPLPPKSNSDTR